MKIIVTLSGGKDSVASLLWTMNNLTENVEVCFCDTKWESPITYHYIETLTKKLGVNLTTLTSKRFDGMIDLALKKSRFPSSQRRFCTSELKSIPMIDYILDHVKDDFIVIQGIRADESEKRAKMQQQCNYFKYYFDPYGYDKNGKPKYHTYRKKEVLKYCSLYATDVLRPVFDWTAQQVIDYSIDAGIEPNPLYKMGFKRVGCFPCIMCSHYEIHQLIRRFPERIEEIAKHEQDIPSSFFGPDKIPAKFYKGEYPLLADVVRYINNKHAEGDLFDDYTPRSCMSFYGLCE